MGRRRRQFGEIQEVRSRIVGRASRFRVRYIGPDGRRYSPPVFDTYGAAESFLIQVQADIRLGLWSPEKASGQQAVKVKPVMFAEFAENCIVNRMNRPVKPLRRSTADNYRKQLRLELLPAFGDQRVDEITEGDVNAWHKASSAKGHPTQTANAYLFLNSVMNEAVAARIIDSNPCRVPGAKGKPAPKHEAEALSAEELRDYLKAVPKQYRVPLMVAAVCGLRSGEVRGLRVRDVDPDSGRISVQQAVTRIKGEYIIDKPKTKAGIRTVYAPELLREGLAAHLKVKSDGSRDGLLFTARDGRSPLHSTILREAHLKGRDAIKRPTLRFHDLRNTAATLAAQQGATVKEIMVMLGHTTPEVAMIYQAAGEQRMKDIANRMDDALKHPDHQ